MKALYISLIIIVVSVIISVIIYFSISDSPNNTQTKKIIQYQKKKIIENFKVPTKYVNHRSLFDLYYTGIPDVYDNNNNKIAGVHPDPSKTIYHLKMLIDSEEGTINDILTLAKLYHQGMHKFNPDLEKAEQVYQSLLDKKISENIRIECLENLELIHKIRVHKWLNLPLDQDENGYENGHERGVGINVDNNFLIDLEDIIFDRRMFEISDKGIDYDDPQNVHNSTVLGTVKNSLENLKKDIENDKLDVNEIKDLINNMEDSHKKRDALKSLDHINSNNIMVTSVGMKEMDALGIVWNKIKNEYNDNQDVKDALIDRLADMQEYGETVCPTGRITRIVDTLNTIDENVNILPTYAINSEMMSKAANIRTKLLETYNESDKKLLEEGTSPNQSSYDSTLKNEIMNSLTKDYVDTKILSKTKFDNEISKWIDEI
jgi:hypothetical protein